jgi:hypothetical protein
MEEANRLTIVRGARVAANASFRRARYSDAFEGLGLRVQPGFDRRKEVML